MLIRTVILAYIMLIRTVILAYIMLIRTGYIGLHYVNTYVLYRPTLC